VSISSDAWTVHERLAADPKTPGEIFSRIQWDYRGKMPPAKKRFRQFLKAVTQSENVPVAVSAFDYYVHSLRQTTTHRGRAKVGGSMDADMVDKFTAALTRAGGNGPAAAIAALERAQQVKGFEPAFIRPSALLRLLRALPEATPGSSDTATADSAVRVARGMMLDGSDDAVELLGHLVRHAGASCFTLVLVQTLAAREQACLRPAPLEPCARFPNHAFYDPASV
jgi:hypothetical protein